MLDLPRGPELLDTARRSLLEDILPALPPEQSYAARMIAKAMAIAARELECGAATENDGLRLIADFLGDEAATALAAGSQTPAGAAAERAQALLAERIRGRAIAPGREAQLRALLLQLTRAKLAVSNPKYLSRPQA